MGSRPLPSQSYLRECFLYSPETGVLVWRERPRSHFKTERAWRSSNTLHAGTVVGTFDEKGYRIAKLAQRMVKASRIIWKLVHDEEVVEIDHIDREPSNDRLANLRPATSSQNKCNQRVRAASGLKGVYRVGRRWQAAISPNGRRVHLGYFATPEEASVAYRQAAVANFGEFATFN